MNQQKIDAIYHSCRMAFVMGQEGVDWFYILHALREGIGSKHVTHTLTEAERGVHHYLRQLIDELKSATDTL